MKTIKLTDVTGVGPAKAKVLEANGIDTVEKLAAADVAVICAMPGFKEALTVTMQKSAHTLLASSEPEPEAEPAIEDVPVAEEKVEEPAEETPAAIAEEPKAAAKEKKSKDKKKSKKKDKKSKKKDKKSKKNKKK